MPQEETVLQRDGAERRIDDPLSHNQTAAAMDTCNSFRQTDVDKCTHTFVIRSAADTTYASIRLIPLRDSQCMRAHSRS